MTFEDSSSKSQIISSPWDASVTYVWTKILCIRTKAVYLDTLPGVSPLAACVTPLSGRSRRLLSALFFVSAFFKAVWRSFRSLVSVLLFAWAFLKAVWRAALRVLAAAKRSEVVRNRCCVRSSFVATTAATSLLRNYIKY